ncbi:hypothetical protein V1477_015158 [Vespula maculifrons]|uniref:Uncharacterized protein n=1 Tax=Vespula maculifrons TaxID=7453 RepID=A0ABD2BJI8_VESMC
MSALLTTSRHMSTTMLSYSESMMAEFQDTNNNNNNNSNSNNNKFFIARIQEEKCRKVLAPDLFISETILEQVVGADHRYGRPSPFMPPLFQLSLLAGSFNRVVTSSSTTTSTFYPSQLYLPGGDGGGDGGSDGNGGGGGGGDGGGGGGGGGS